MKQQYLQDKISIHKGQNNLSTQANLSSPRRWNHGDGSVGKEKKIYACFASKGKLRNCDNCIQNQPSQINLIKLKQFWGSVTIHDA
jgi:hypothetical protein